MKTLYPSIEPFQRFFLATDSVHSVYVEQSGNSAGLPVIFLHGGPCSGTKPDHRRFFNPDKYHIILMDQRGCGQSLPYGEVENNTTQDLLNDMESIRRRLNIEKWVLFGGSWGSTLTLLYAQQYTEHVAGMVIRGVFLARQKDLDWFGADGVGRIYPEKWQQLQQTVLNHSKTDLIAALYYAIFNQDKITQECIAKAWIDWGSQVALMQDYQVSDYPQSVTKKMLQQTQMELHYAYNKYFVIENQLLNKSKNLPQIPTTIIHGRNDLVCPMEAATSLFKVLPQAEFIILEQSGHIASDQVMIDALIDASDKMLLRQI